MEKPPRVSVITVCYNAAKCIEQTIKSVISQTYSNLEYVIIDGKSTDNTMEIVKKYSSQIDIIISEPDKGIYNAMNKGIARCTGKWLNFMNAGDSFAKDNVIEQISKYFVNENKIVYGNVYLLFSHNRIIKINQPHNPNLVDFGLKSINHQSAFIHKSMFDKYGMYDENYKLASDWKFFATVIGLNQEKSYYAKDINVCLFDMEGVSNQNQEKYINERQDMQQKIFGPFLPYIIELAEYKQSKTLILLLKIRRAIKKNEFIKQIKISLGNITTRLNTIFNK